MYLETKDTRLWFALPLAVPGTSHRRTVCAPLNRKHSHLSRVESASSVYVSKSAERGRYFDCSPVQMASMSLIIVEYGQRYSFEQDTCDPT
jgi:hypothetical protein